MLEKKCVVKVRLLLKEGLLLGEDKARLIYSLIPSQSGKNKATTQVFSHF